MTLDPMPTAADARSIARERQIRRYGRIIDVALLTTAERDQLAPIDTRSRAQALHGMERRAPIGEASTGWARPFTLAKQSDVSMTVPIMARRELDTLWLVIETPPRTKKNHTQAFGIRQSKAYKTYAADIAGAIASVKTALMLPLPERKYNIAITYYVDSRWGARADRPGLDQGLFDALENAGVIPNDWLFRTTEGTPEPIVCHEGERPRIECVITPLSEVQP